MGSALLRTWIETLRLLAGKYGFGSSRILSREETLERLPTLKMEGLRGGAIYYDGQFDDARLLIHMAATAHEQGAVLLNYVEVTGLTKDAQGFVDGVMRGTSRRRQEFHAAAKVVINATGAFSDRLRLIAEPQSAPMIAPSQGIHLVFDSAFPGGRERDHGSAYVRWARALCDPVARSYAGWNDRHADSVGDS